MGIPGYQANLIDIRGKTHRSQIIKCHTKKRVEFARKAEKGGRGPGGGEPGDPFLSLFLSGDVERGEGAGVGKKEPKMDKGRTKILPR